MKVMRSLTLISLASLLALEGCQLWFRESEPDAQVVVDAKPPSVGVPCVGSTNGTTTVTFTAEADAAIVEVTPLGLAPRLPVAQRNVLLLRFPIVASHVKSFELRLTSLSQDSNSGMSGCAVLAPLKATLQLHGMVPAWAESQVQAKSSGTSEWSILTKPDNLVSAPIITKDAGNNSDLLFGVNPMDHERIISFLAAQGQQGAHLAVLIAPTVVSVSGAFQSREKPVCDSLARPPQITAQVCY